MYKLISTLSLFAVITILGCFNSSTSSTNDTSIPTLEYPGQNATGIEITTTLIWDTVVGATSYHVQLSTDPDFATTLVNDSMVPGVLRVVGPMLNNTVYYWRVSAKNATGTSAYSTRQSFTTIAGSSFAPSSLTGKKLKVTRTFGEINFYNFTTATAYIDSVPGVSNTNKGTYTYAASGSASTITMNQTQPDTGIQNIFTVTWTSDIGGTFKLTRHLPTFSFNDSGTVSIIP